MKRQRATLGKLCTLVKGTSPIMKTKPGPYPLVTTGEERKTSDSFQLDAEAVCVPLISSTGHGHASLKRIHYQIGKFALANILVAAIVKNGAKLSPKFLTRYLNFTKDRLIVPFMTGAANMSISVDRLATVPIEFPSVSDQERIVNLLDEVDELRKTRDKADQHTGSLIPALFHEMFGGNKFQPVRVGDLSALITSGSTPRGGGEIYTKEGPHFIRSQNVRMNWLDLSEAACLPVEIHEQMVRTKVAIGDVLLNITGASIGRVAWVDDLDREANVSQHVCLIRPKPDFLKAAYLSVFISLPTTQQFILQIQAGSSRQALNHQQVRALEIPLPPLSLQKDFAQRATEILGLEMAQSSSRQRLDDLFQAMLHRAFSGEL